jgi:hypothetical protein
MTTLLTPKLIATEALIALENNMVFGNLVHRSYETEVQSGRGATVTIRKPTTFTATAFSSTVAAQTVTESSVQVVLDQHFDVSFELTAKELSLDIKEFSTQTIEPAMRAHAQAMDYALAGLYVNIAGHYPVTSTPVVADIALLAAQLNNQKVPMTDRRCVLCPNTQAAYVALEPFLFAEHRGGDLQAIKEAEMGRVMGMDFYMDQNIRTATSYSTSDLLGTVSAGFAAAATAGTVAALTDGQIITAGDVFKIAGDSTGYLVTTGGTVASNSVVLVWTPALAKAGADGAVVTFQSTHKANLAFHKNAFALVTAPLAMPLGGATGAYVSYKGLSCRVVYGYNTSTKTNTCSLDVLYGVKTLDKELAARLCDARSAAF